MVLVVVGYRVLHVLRYPSLHLAGKQTMAIDTTSPPVTSDTPNEFQRSNSNAVDRTEINTESQLDEGHS